MIDLLHAMGTNECELVKRVALRVTEVVRAIMVASGQETAWLCLRAFTPIDLYDLSRWHMDGYYFTPTNKEDLMYKFAVTLRGASTLFYPVSQVERNKVWKKTINREYMQAFCKQDQMVSPQQGEGVFFIGGRTDQSALHSEPSIRENRLFFSIVPCNEKQIGELKKKVRPLPIKK